MAQRKSTPSGRTPSGKATPGKGPARPSGKPSGASGSKPANAGTRTSAAKPAAKPAAAAPRKAVPAGKGAGGRPPVRKPAKSARGKSIVNQKQTPWGLIWSAVAVVVFAAVVVTAVVVTHKSGSGGATNTSKGGQAVKASDPYRQPELPAAAKISGVTYRVEGNHTHVQGHIKYDATPPVGGNHSQYWADCTGTIYTKAIANENAVHMLEHGAIWITYNSSTLPAAQLTKLKTYVSGVNMMALSPYPNLKTPISLQAWGYQLFVTSASDPRIAQFISTLKLNKKTTPEYGATCSQPTFKKNPSTFGHPLWVPANGATGNTSGK